MPLNFEEIEKIVNNEKNAGGFAELIRDFKKAGVQKYDYLVNEGIYRYYDQDSFVDIQMNGVPKPVAAEESETAIKEAVEQAQSGSINFEKFTELAGKSGVVYWSTDLNEKVVEYKGTSGRVLLKEPIPEL